MMSTHIKNEYIRFWSIRFLILSLFFNRPESVTKVMGLDPGVRLNQAHFDFGAVFNEDSECFQLAVLKLSS